MNKENIKNDIDDLEASKGQILKKYIPHDYYVDHIIEKDNEILFSLDIVCKYLVFLNKNIIDKKKNFIKINNIKYFNTKSILRMLNDNKIHNKFRTIDLNNELGMVSIYKDNRYIYNLETSLHIVDDSNSKIKYTLEAQFLYTVYKYLQYLKYETEEKVFLKDFNFDFIHPQYNDMRTFHFDLYLPSVKICIEYSENYVNRTPEQIELDEIRLKIIEDDDIIVLTYDSTKENPMNNLTNFLLNLKNTIMERSLYFTKKITIDQYLYFFEKKDLINIDITRKILEIRENKMEYKLSLKQACDLIKLFSDEYDFALKIIKDKLDLKQYNYDGDFKFENIYLNGAGFCDFCVLIGSETSKKILCRYRKIEDMCNKMISKIILDINEQNRKKKENEIVVNTFLKKMWKFNKEAEFVMLKKKYDKVLASQESKKKLLIEENTKIKNEIDKLLKDYGIIP